MQPYLTFFSPMDPRGTLPVKFFKQIFTGSPPNLYQFFMVEEYFVSKVRKEEASSPLFIPLSRYQCSFGDAKETQ